jgi:translation initiation factor IF-2
VLGLTAVPGAGDTFLAADEDRTVRQIAEQRQARRRAAEMAISGRRRTLEEIFDDYKEGEKTTLNLILKGDGSGSVEALEDALVKIVVSDEVQLRIIHRGVGAVTQDDVNLASASDAIVIGFNVRAEGRIRELADREGVEIRYYTVIYQAIEEIETALKGMLKPIYEEVELGTAEIREVFRSSRFGNIAGCLVRSGLIRRNAKARLLRDGAVVSDNLSIAGLRRFKDDATEVREGFECGIGLGSWNNIEVEDTIETYDVREKPRA